MKRGFSFKNCFLLFLFLVFVFSLVSVFDVNAQVEDYNDHSNLTLRVTIDNSFSVSGGNIDFISANISHFPKTEGLQQVVRLDYSASPVVTNLGYDEMNIPFFWKNPSSSTYSFNIVSDVVVANAIQTIDSKIKFPIEPIDTQYVKFGEKIDIDNDIRAKAQELATGEDDLYFVAFKVGDWVERNIDYDLNSLTAEVTEKSSWVFANKQGVCDELTGLFISMMRSLGVPARFVSGEAYTNLGHKWGPHAWAEVYFPGRGWVPFDVTYRQFGWIDPSHIKMKSSFDSSESAVKYLWRGNNVKVNVDPVDIDVGVVSLGPKIKTSPVSLTVRSAGDNFGPGSYVPIEIIIQNNQPFYVPNALSIIKAEELEGDNVKNVLLRPNEKRSIYWLMKIPAKLQPYYTYSTVVEVEDTFHSSQAINVTYSFDGNIFSKDQALNLISSYDEEKVYSRDLQLRCESPSYAYYYESYNIDCVIRNNGNVPLVDVNICYENDCKVTNLGIAEQSNPKFVISDLQVGRKNIEIKADSKEASAIYRLSFDVFSDPDLRVSEISYDKNMDFHSESEMNFVMIVKAPVNNIKIYFDNREIATLDELISSKRAKINVRGMDFLKADSFNLKITFNDKNGKDYSFSQDYPLTVSNIPWYIKLVRWLGLQ